MAYLRITSAYKQLERVSFQRVSPEKCHVKGKGREVAKLGERATAVLHVVDNERKAYTKPVESLICELVSESNGEKIDCSVKKTEAIGQYEISYQATSRGRHQLHVILEGKHIIGSPFPVFVKRPLDQLGKPMKTITGHTIDNGELHKLKGPWGVAINSKGNIVVSEWNGNCVSVIDPAEEKVILSFGSYGSSPGQFKRSQGVAVDDEDNILVVDGLNSRIQKFAPDGTFKAATRDYIQLNSPEDIAIHPDSKKLYISSSESSHHCIKILNPDLTFSDSFGSSGSGYGQFSRPKGVAFDSTGKVYVADQENYRIQVFTAEGRYLRKFGRKELYQPIGICIDREDVVYVTEAGNQRVSLFKCDGVHVKSFGSRGSGLGQFNKPFGIALDKDENIYVADMFNNRIQKF